MCFGVDVCACGYIFVFVSECMSVTCVCVGVGGCLFFVAGFKAGIWVHSS